MDRTSQTIKLEDGRTLGFAEYGDPKGRPLFYFHGWPSSRLSGTRYQVAAKKLHIRLIGPDRPGYGLSDYKENRTLLDWADDVVELADQLHIKKFSAMGVSGGGPYVAVCGYRIPDRLTSAGIVVGLAPTFIPHILDGMLWTARLGWANYPSYPLLRTLAALNQEFMVKIGPGLGLHRFLFGSRSDQQLYSDPNIRLAMRMDTREAFRHGYKGPALDLELYTKDWGFRLDDIRSHVYLWYGEEDTNAPLAMGKYYAAHIFKSKLYVYRNEGHLLSRVHAEEILATLVP